MLAHSYNVSTQERRTALSADQLEFWVSLGYSERPCLTTNKKYDKGSYRKRPKGKCLETDNSN